MEAQKRGEKICSQRVMVFFFRYFSMKLVPCWQFLLQLRWTHTWTFPLFNLWLYASWLLLLGGNCILAHREWSLASVGETDLHVREKKAKRYLDTNTVVILQDYAAGDNRNLYTTVILLSSSAALLLNGSLWRHTSLSSRLHTSANCQWECNFDFLFVYL